MRRTPLATLRWALRWATLALPALALAILQVGATCTEQAGAHPEMLRNQAACVQYLEKQDPDRAETRCEICLQYDPKNAECLNGLGLVWYYRGVDEKARGFFKEAIRFNNDFAQARNNLGVMDFKNEDFAKAASMFDSAVEIDPAYMDARYNLALCYLRLGQIERGEQLRRPEDKRDFSKELEWYEKADREYRKIFELAPTHTGAYHDMGVIETFRAENATTENKKREHTGEAERYFKRCLEIDVTHETCHGNLAHLYLAVGRFDEALFHFIQCLAANKDNPICANELPLAYKGASMQSESIKRYIEQIQQNPGYAPAHYGLCLAFFAKGLVDMAVVECENTVKLDPEYCLAQFQLGEHYRRVLDRDKALTYCRQFIGCAGDQHPTEVETCKETVRALEAQ
ncbi:MAG: tetratricopeptide repeat protein [Pseudomonadota bacterium]